MTFDEARKYFYWFVDLENYDELGENVDLLTLNDVRNYAASMGLNYRTEMKFNLLTDEEDNFKVDWNWILNK